MDQTELRAWRKAERTRLIEARTSLPIDQHRQKSEAISRHLFERFPAVELQALGGYWPYRREFDCLPLLRAAIKAGGSAALPVVVEKGKPLEFRRWTPDCKMEAGVWNILHPAEGPAV